jgi:hypothetical protein
MFEVLFEEKEFNLGDLGGKCERMRGDTFRL